MMKENDTEAVNDSSQNSVVLMMKKYEEGLLTKTLLDSDPLSLKLHLSCLRGEGLHFGEIKPGRIIMVAGGTGLFPFSDLIDLLFKSVLVLQRPELKAKLCKQDPILNGNPFNGFSFELYLAVNNLEDIHPLTLAQLSELANKQDLMKITIRVSKPVEEMHQKINEKIVFTKTRFTSTLEKILPEGHFERVWVCGPPPMNEELVNMFDRF